MARASTVRRMVGAEGLLLKQEGISVAVEERGVSGVALVTVPSGGFFRDGEPMPW